MTLSGEAWAIPMLLEHINEYAVAIDCTPEVVVIVLDELSPVYLAGPDGAQTKMKVQLSNGAPAYITLDTHGELPVQLSTGAVHAISLNGAPYA